MVSKSKKCKACKSEIDKQATICYQCGSYQSCWSSFFKKYTPNAIAFVAIVISFYQLSLAKDEKSQAQLAAEQADSTLKVVRIIEKDVQKKDSALKLLVKANADNTKIQLQTTLFVSNLNDSLSRIVKHNNEIINEIFLQSKHSE